MARIPQESPTCGDLRLRTVGSGISLPDSQRLLLLPEAGAEVIKIDQGWQRALSREREWKAWRP
jgi:hypothetical protein